MSFEPRANPVLTTLARSYVRRRVRRELDGLFVEGLDRARALSASEPLIVASTHVAWWDALMVLLFGQLLDAQVFGLMDAESLRRLPFFGWVGALPLDRSSPGRCRRDLQRAADVLNRPSRVLWIFPQGRQRPAHMRPLGLQRGVQWLSARSGARVLPLSISYAFRQAPWPAALASFGTPMACADAAWLATLEAQLVGGTARADRFVDTGEGEFREVVAARARQRDSLPWPGRLISAWMRRRTMQRLSAEGARG